MKLICATLLLLFSFHSAARTDVMRTLFLSKAPFHNEIDNSEEHQDSFELNGEFGALYASGNTTGTTLTGKLNAKHDIAKWHNRYAARLLYKQSESEFEGDSQLVASAQRVFASIQSDYKLNNPAHRLFIFGEYDDDRFNAYQYQAAVAVGWTEEVWSDDKSELTYSVGPGYARSIAKPSSNARSQTGLIFRAAMEYETKINDFATFRQYVSTETDDEFSRSISETSVDARINGSLKMKLSINMIHNRSPQKLQEEFDTQTAVTLVYQFF